MLVCRYFAQNAAYCAVFITYKIHKFYLLLLYTYV